MIIGAVFGILSFEITIISKYRSDLDQISNSPIKTSEKALHYQKMTLHNPFLCVVIGQLKI